MFRNTSLSSVSTTAASLIGASSALTAFRFASCIRMPVSPASGASSGLHISRLTGAGVHPELFERLAEIAGANCLRTPTALLGPPAQMTPTDLALLVEAN
jgi:hypothetical protein